MAETFNEMLSSLDEAYRTQQRFVADASHELRTPLTAIQGNVGLLERMPQIKDKDRIEALAQLRQESARMSRLVADLLMLARADAGQGLKLTGVELDRLVMEAFKEARLLARGQKISLTSIDQLQVEGDRDRLKQLLLILMDNAVRYTPEGGEIRMALNQEHGQARVTVQDTGIGISSEDLPHIFERFYRADKARVREAGGAGLGLPIALWIAERHGGTISVESSPGHGCTFTLRLPLA
jgi:two-component system OmpR family sensor kinase